MRRLVLISSALLALSGGHALAADASAFEGAFGGVFAGYAGTTFEGVVDSSEFPDYPEEAEVFTGDRVFGLAYGAVAGVNSVDGDKVFGLEGTVYAGNLSDTAIDEGGNDYSTHRIDAIALVGARAGVAVTDDTLLFAKVGAGIIASTFTAYNDMDESEEFQIGSTRIFGPVLAVGAGVEQVLSENIHLRVDGTYVLPIGQYEFADEQLTDDMDDGDYAKIGGTFILTAGLVAQF